MTLLNANEPRVHPDCSITDSKVGRYCEIGLGSRLNNSTLGDYSYCDRYADIANAQIGKFANIASFVRIGATDHPMDRASQHHFLYRSADYWADAKHDEAFFEKRKARQAHIGHDTWIGHNAQIKPDTKIGHGAVVASGAIVTRDVAPYTIVAGVPAQPVKPRFSSGIADRIIALSWWDWDHQQLRQALPDFRNMEVQDFLEKYE